MHERNFALGVAYSTTEVLKVAIFALVFLGGPLSFRTALAVLSGTLGVLLLSPGSGSILMGGSRAARFGLASGWRSPCRRSAIAARRSRLRRHRF
jgi:drug/metabolite transporter (DMT)-like permease